VIIMPMKEGQPRLSSRRAGNENSYPFLPVGQLPHTTTRSSSSASLPDEVDPTVGIIQRAFLRRAPFHVDKSSLIEVLEEWFDRDPEL
jgi:hypothetical protein